MGFDNAIVPSLRLINLIPELVTVFSCQGHPEREDYDAYLLLAATDLTVAWALYELFREAYREQTIGEPVLGFTLETYLVPVKPLLMNVYYPAVVIRWHPTDYVDVMTYTRALEMATTQYLVKNNIELPNKLCPWDNF